MTKKNNKIPKFKSIAEEAAFWDTHSFASHWDKFKPVQVQFAKNLSQGITVRLDSGSLNKLRSLADHRGLGPTTLARMWILEQLRKAERPMVVK